MSTNDPATPVNWHHFDIGEVSRKMPQDWYHVTSLDEGGNYEWATLHAFWSPSARRYFWLGAGGCSCSWWGSEVYSEADFENGQKSDLERALRSFQESERFLVSSEALRKAIADLHAWDPRKLDTV